MREDGVKPYSTYLTWKVQVIHAVTFWINSVGYLESAYNTIIHSVLLGLISDRSRRSSSLPRNDPS